MPRINPRTARSRGFVEPPYRPGPIMQFILFVWFLIRFVVASAVAAAFVGFAVLLWFGFTMPEEPEEAETKTDAIVVLTGGGGRLEHGYELLKRGLAARLLVTGAGEKTTKEALLKQRLGEVPSDLAARIQLDHRAEDTKGNAEQTANWFNSQNLKSMRIVTSNYHMRRAYLQFRRAMPDARILISPVVPKGYGVNEWWTHREGVIKVAEELGATIAAFFRIPIRR
jgi:uncharacterized SAM-binding protein YcdF (DUF218 family)